MTPFTLVIDSKILKVTEIYFSTLYKIWIINKGNFLDEDLNAQKLLVLSHRNQHKILSAMLYNTPKNKHVVHP